MCILFYGHAFRFRYASMWECAICICILSICTGCIFMILWFYDFTNHFMFVFTKRIICFVTDFRMTKFKMTHFFLHRLLSANEFLFHGTHSRITSKKNRNINPGNKFVWNRRILKKILEIKRVDKRIENNSETKSYLGMFFPTNVSWNKSFQLILSVIAKENNERDILIQCIRLNFP